MIKDEIIREIDKLGVERDEFWVVGSASLVLRGLFRSADDIDIAFTKSGFEILKTKYDVVYLGNNGCDWYKINDIIECCVDEKNIDKVDEFEPYNLLNLNYYYNNFLKDSMREKDRYKREVVRNTLINYYQK